MSEKPEHSIGTRTLRGMFWAYGSFVSVRLASLLTTAVLARLLAPKDFGLIALAMTFMAFLDTMQGLGVGSALVISSAADIDDEANTAFVVSTAAGFVLWLLSAALGPVAAALFHQPRLVEVMPALGLTFLLYGVSSTHYSLALKAIDIRSRTAAEIAEAVARGAVGVGLALAGLGVWSLIGGYVAGSVAMVAVLWKMIPWRPRLQLQRRYVHRLLSFGGAVTGVGVMGAFLNQFDNAVVGRVLGATALGFYSIANRLPYLLIISLASATGDVLFPAFATLDGERLRGGYLTALRYAALIALPLTAVLVTLARPLTLVVFGPRWLPSVTATQVLCIWALMSPISMVCGNVLKARNRATLLLSLAVPQAVALIVGSLLLVREGIVAVAWVQAGIAVAAQVVTLWIVGRMLELRPLRVLRTLGLPALATIGLALVLVGIDRELNDPWIVVLVGGVIGAMVYLGLVRLLMPKVIGDLHRMALPGRAARLADAESEAVAGADPASPTSVPIAGPVQTPPGS